MTSYVYEPLTAGSLEIRPLTLEPNEFHSDIECSLRDVVLAEAPAYEALSYVWWNPQDTRTIKLAGSTCSVTKNLEAALRHLRHQHTKRLLWVDAICINQKDDQEKAQQVQIMYAIYSSAKDVIAWMGDPYEDGGRAMDIIREMASKFMNTHLNFSEENPITHITPEHFERMGIDLNAIDWLCVWNFLNRPYWSRVWIMQELAACHHLAREGGKGTIVCGFNSMPKYYFDLVITLIMLTMMSPGFRYRGQEDQPAWMWACIGAPAAEEMARVLAGLNRPESRSLCDLLNNQSGHKKTVRK